MKMTAWRRGVAVAFVIGLAAQVARMDFGSSLRNDARGSTPNGGGRTASTQRRVAISFLTADARAITFSAEVAETPSAQRQGLSGRAELGALEGMLFPFAQDATPTFTMAGMRFPLDIIFLDRSGGVLAIAENLPPCPNQRSCATVTPPVPIAFALEVNAGFSARYGIVPGSTLTIGR